MHEVPLHILIATADRSELLARTLSSLAACAIPPSLVSTLVVENGPPSGAEQMMRQAQQTVLLADSGKFGQQALVQLCNLAEIDIVVTDSRLADEHRQAVEQAGCRLLIA